MNKVKVLFLVLLLLSAIIASSNHQSVEAVSQNIDWSKLRGVNYHDPVLWTNDADARLGYPPAPQISFPMMSQYGFNFIRVPIFWGMLSVNTSGYLKEIQLVGSTADQNGIAVIYSQFNTACLGAGNTQFFLRHEFPPAIENQFTTMTSLFDQYYINNITDPTNGLLVWQDTVQNFWKPVIAAVDSHPSTVGYELANEPCAPNDSTLTNYDTYFAQQLRSLTSKAIVYGSRSYDTLPGSANPPQNVTNLVQDVHSYDNPSQISSTWASIGRQDKTPMLIGEFGTLNPTCETTQPCLDNIYRGYITAAHQYGFGIAFWEWACSNNGNTGLLDANCQPDWRVQDLSNYYDSILSSNSTSETHLSASTWITVGIVVVVVVSALILALTMEKKREISTKTS